MRRRLEDWQEAEMTDDHMSLEHLCATCRAARVRAEHPITAASRQRSLASLAIFALAPHSVVGANGGAPAVLLFRISFHAPCHRVPRLVP